MQKFIEYSIPFHEFSEIVYGRKPLQYNKGIYCHPMVNFMLSVQMLKAFL